eukprot:TRINITY_DN23484_c0_g1_i1.p1 TRINITY_DN23484_c0_g1~~TRINITY_DN23484_c0_g1_i1.p1  ORF type:complete len:242 (-),score=61.14 TRINITY_DN23484_c0_g1_i1:10-735(-)
MSNPRAWIDVSIGDSVEHATQIQRYERADAFVKALGPSYGWGESLSGLDESTLETVREIYAADPTWSSKGPIRTRAPPPLLAGRIVIELFADQSPKAVENFLALSSGEKGKSKESGKPLHFKGCPFHRIVAGFMAQTGDFTRGDGSGGESVFGKKFNDDKGGLKLKHDAAGIVSMANSGKNSNSSQFFITFGPLPQLDGKHVVLGRAVEGLDVVRRLETIGSKDGKPSEHATISDCGVFQQ